MLHEDKMCPYCIHTLELISLCRVVKKNISNTNKIDFSFYQFHIVTTQEDVCQDSSKFQCRDFTCIDIAYRCDFKIQCPDASDERGCRKYFLP